MRAFTITVITLFALSATTGSAIAKDPFSSIEPIIGLKIMKSHKLTKDSYKFSASKFSVSDSSRTQLVEFLYMGGTELQLNDGKKIHRVTQSGWGSNTFSWEQNGRTYIVNSIPNSQGALSGSIFLGNKKLGGFSLYNSKIKAPSASGRWDGVLAFPGGAQLQVALQVSGRSHYFGNACQAWFPTRVDIPGSSYTEGYISICGKGDQNHEMNFFYWDRENNDVWFFTIDGSVFYKGTVFQGSAWGFSLYGNGSSEGKFYLTRPDAFSL